MNPTPPPPPPRKPRKTPSPPSPTLLPHTDAGPRPVTARQQSARENRLTGRDIIDRAVPPRAKPAMPPPSARDRSARRTAPNRRHIRDADTTRIRVVIPGSAASPQNRRRVNYPLVLLRGATAFLVLECVAALLFSPRLWVTETRVEGNVTVPANQLLGCLRVPVKQNIVRLSTGRLRKTVLDANPAIETAEIHRRLPGTVTLVIHERKPWASVCLPEGACYTIDHNLVPFRKSNGPVKGLPKLNLSTGEGDTAPVAVMLGKRLNTLGLGEVSKCLAWADAHRFPLASVEIDPSGKLCLNRMGSVPVRLGSGPDLDKKLDALGILLDRKPELRDTTDVAYINLYAYDAPAVMPRSAVSVAKAVPGDSASSSPNAPELVPTAQPPPAADHPERNETNGSTP